MWRLIALCSVLMFVEGCGREDPDVRPADWEANFDRARQASASNQHDQAIAIAEGFLKDHPDNVDGHQMVGDAYREAAKAASGARRAEWFAQAAAHYTRALDLTKNPTWRLQATTSLRDINGSDGLNNPADAIRYGRMLIANDPKNIHTYAAMLTVLQDARKYDDAVALLAEAKQAIEPTVDAWSSYAYMACALVKAPEFPPATARTVLADAGGVIDGALTRYGRIEKLLYNKAEVLSTQEGLESDPALKRALSAEWTRIQQELDRLSK